MPLIDHWADYRHRVEPHLEPGESMLAFTATSVARGTAPAAGPPSRRLDPLASG